MAKAVKAKAKAKTGAASDEQLTKNFWLSEFTYSRTAIAAGLSNKPSAAQLAMIRWVATNVAQPIRDLVKGPVRIDSGFRSPKVNAAVGGEEKSFHQYTGDEWAFDFFVPSMSLFEVMELLKESSLPFTKAILELDQGIIHVQGKVRQLLVRDVIDGKKVYTFLDDYKGKGNV